MGTPDFAARILNSVTVWPGGRVIGVYTQPDRPAGRGNKLKESAVKTLARSLNIPVHQPINFRQDNAVHELRELRPDVLVVAAYGLILPQCVLDIPVLGPFNVHASLLPKYRGAAPIQRAIMQGEKWTGVSIMRMEAGLDTGPILSQQAVTIELDETAGSLFRALAEHGAALMTGALGMLAENRAAYIPQNDAVATYAPKLSAAEEQIPWHLSAQAVHNHIRGISPDPGAKTSLRLSDREPLLLRVEPGLVFDPAARHGQTPGTLLGFERDALLVACGVGVYGMTHLQPSGKSRMTATDFRNGRLRGLEAPYGLFFTKPHA